MDTVSAQQPDKDRTDASDEPPWVIESHGHGEDSSAKGSLEQVDQGLRVAVMLLGKGLGDICNRHVEDFTYVVGALTVLCW